MVSDRTNAAATFGQVVRERRVELGLTQEELAARVGDTIRQSDISRMERDYVMLPRRDRLEALAAALEVTPGYLLMHSGWITGEERARLESGGSIGENALASLPGPYMDVPPPETLSDPASVSTPDALSSPLNVAITRAHQEVRRTDAILRQSESTMENARRTRRKPD